MSSTSLNGIAALSSTLLFLSTSSVALRFYARHKQQAALAVDDWMMLSAWVFFVGLVSISFYGITHKFMGFHIPQNKKLLAEEHPMVEKSYTAFNGLAVITLGLAKLSALFFYRRIFLTGLRNLFDMVTSVTIVVVVVWTVAFFIFTFLICGPNINYLFAIGHSASAKCKTIYPYFMGTSISDFLLDLFILCLPMPKIWSLNTNPKRKIAISGVFLFAFVGFAASTARMAISIYLVKRGRAVNDEDAYQSSTQLAYFNILEAGMVLIAVNLPSLWYYVSNVTPNSVLNSVRSAFSLGSRHSNSPSSVRAGSKSMGSPKNSKSGHSMHTNSSGEDLVGGGPNEMGVETLALADLEVGRKMEGTGIGVETMRKEDGTVK